MTTTGKISFIDNSASNAWEEAKLGEFDPDSAIAAAIDTDADGLISESEIKAYQASHPSEDSTEYDIVDISEDELQGGVIEMSEIMNKAIKAFGDITAFVKKLVEQVLSAASNAASDAAEVTSTSGTEYTSETAPSRLTQVSSDIDTTESSVDKVLDKVNNGGAKKGLFGGFFKRLFERLFKHNNNEADIAKINQLGGEAKAGAKTARVAVTEAADKLGTPETSTSDDQDVENSDVDSAEKQIDYKPRRRSREEV